MNTKVVSSYKLDVETRKKLKILATEMGITAGELIELLLKKFKEESKSA
jgi:antitoxin component of RelBE/YafQ-DinJ toxin-antitoxin module